MRSDVKAGRYDAEVVEVVLGAQREVEVLRLLARGLSNKQIAEQLVVSPNTVANHVEHIYAKIGASTRARASLFAMQHGLLPEEEYFVGPTPVGAANA